MKPVADPEIEHLLPHKNGAYPERRFDWYNLFWSCRHCNSVKNQKKYESGILDCCKEDPEEYLILSLEEDTVTVHIFASCNQKVFLTVELIYEVFNLKNTGIRLAACEARIENLQIEMGKLYSALDEYRKNPDSTSANQKMRILLRRESAFAGFKRSYVRLHLAEYPELEKYIA